MITSYVVHVGTGTILLKDECVVITTNVYDESAILRLAEVVANDEGI